MYTETAQVKSNLPHGRFSVMNLGYNGCRHLITFKRAERPKKVILLCILHRLEIASPNLGSQRGLTYAGLFESMSTDARIWNDSSKFD